MSTLILHLPLAPPGPATEYRYTLSNDGHSVSNHASAALALLPRPSRATGETVALVPAQALSWQRVSLPQGVGRTSPRLRAVLEGLLEDRLLDDPAQLHFALGPETGPSTALWVAICDRAWLRAHLQALETAGCPAARVVPECAPAPTQGPVASVQVLGTPEDAKLLLPCYGPDRGVLLLPLSAPAWALMRPCPADSETPVVIDAEPAVAALAEQVLGQPVQLQTASARALDALGNGWNLAQFDLASTGRTRLLRKATTALGAWFGAPQWRAARWGLGVLVAVHLLGLNLWAWQERQALTHQQTQVRAVLTQTFPQVKVVVDAPMQMEREVALLRQATGSLSARDLSEPLLAAAAGALPPHWQARSIDYSVGQLRLQGPALSATEQTQALQELRANGHTLDTEGDTLVVRTANTP